MKMWTMKEKELLKKHYKQVSMDELLTLLPGRTENSIYKQVSYLRKKGWIIHRTHTDGGGGPMALRLKGSGWYLVFSLAWRPRCVCGLWSGIKSW